MRNAMLGLALGAGFISISPLANASFVLDFEGVGNQAAINGFYNGGTDSNGNSGTDYGVAFSPATLGLIDSDAGGTGNFANEPSPNTILFWLDSSSAIMNVAAGFDTGFSFYYTSSTAATINVYDGLNATGNVIGSIDLSAQYTNNCTGDPNGTFCHWDPIGVSFAGTAYSIDFGGTANQTGYDDITFGSATAGDTGNNASVPEPPVTALLGLGLLGIGYMRRKVV